MKNEINDQIVFKDVFISHTWKDKIEYVEPLVMALETSGISCWYDVTEMKPGDSLIKRINHGLTHSKIILLFLSKNFLEGGWSKEEMETSLSLAIINSETTRIIPLMLEDPKSIIDEYPMQLAKLLYIRWTDNIDEMVVQIKKTLSEIDDIGKEYWIEQTKIAYDKNNYIRSIIYSKKTLEYDNQDYQANIYSIAALLQLDKYNDAFKFVYEKEGEWLSIADDQIDRAVLDYTQDRISNVVNGNEIDEIKFSFAIVEYLSIPNNTSGWKYLARIFDKDEFKFHRSRIVMEAAFMGREDTIDWLTNEVAKSNDEEVKKSLLTVLSFFGQLLPDVKDKSISLIRMYLDDYHEDIRLLTLIPYYNLAEDGSEQAIKALDDKSPDVREQAFELLSGSYDVVITEDWEIETSHEDRKPDSLLTPEIISKLLHDSDEMIVGEVIDKIAEGAIECPPGIDLENIYMSPGEDIRQALVKLLGKKNEKESNAKLIEYVLNDPSEFVRSEAIEILEDSEFPIKSSILKKMYFEETVSDVKEELEDLILKKGNETLADIYLEIFTRSLETSWPNNEALEKILQSKNHDCIQNSLMICQKENMHKLAAEQLAIIIKTGHLAEAISIVKWCLNNKEELDNALLAAGLLKDIPIEDIIAFQEDENLQVRVNALRAAEQRTKNGKYYATLKALYYDLRDQLSENNYDNQWIILSIIDGVLEVDGKEEAIKLLKEFYGILIKEKDSSFPIRATWERLKILGIEIPHQIFSDSGPTVPHPWPDRDGPFYMKVSEIE